MFIFYKSTFQLNLLNLAKQLQQTVECMNAASRRSLLKLWFVIYTQKKKLLCNENNLILLKQRTAPLYLSVVSAALSQRASSLNVGGQAFDPTLLQPDQQAQLTRLVLLHI